MQGEPSVFDREGKGYKQQQKGKKKDQLRFEHSDLCQACPLPCQPAQSQSTPSFRPMEVGFLISSACRYDVDVFVSTDNAKFRR